MVEAGERRQGTGRALGQSLIEALTALGAPRVVLYAAARNKAAQKLFQAMGFRPTMSEMTRES
jgi:ribosomal protein S18 acetylase RimI-like enzyme